MNTPARLHPHDAALLAWRFSDDWRGDCGLRSNFSAMASILELGTRVQTSLAVREWGLDDDAPALVAARRVKLVDDRLRRLHDHRHVKVLRGAYAPRGEHRPEELSPWRSRLDPTREIGGVLLVLPAVREAHATSGTRQSILPWLAGLSAQASLPPPKARQTAARARRREIESLVDTLTALASTALLEAHSAWNDTRGRA